MGQKIITRSSYTPDLEVFISRYFQSQDIHLVEHFDSNPTKTVILVKKGIPFIMKVFFKPDLPEDHSFNDEIKKLQDTYDRIYPSNDTPRSVFGIAPVISIDNQEKTAAILLRQYLTYNLRERIYIEPYLTEIDKIWLSFQMMFSLHSLHSINIHHGHLKLQNILLTSYMSVYLSDIATYKPAYIPIDDNTYYTYYFGHHKESIRTCNLSPERFVEKAVYDELKRNNKLNETTAAMDVFALGCVIAELFLETPLFEYEQLLSYKKNKTLPDEINTQLKKLKDEKLKGIILGMIEHDVDKRLTLMQCIDMFVEHICPISIYRVLVYLNMYVCESNYWKPDLLIGLFYKHWNQIWKSLYGLNCEAPALYQKLNFCIINKLIIKPPFEFAEMKIDNELLRKFPFMFDMKNLNTLLLHEQDNANANEFISKSNADCILIYINYILQSLPFTQHVSSILVGIEMLTHFSKTLPDLMKLQYIIPYLVHLLSKNDNLTRLTSLQYLLDILKSLSFNDLLLPESEYLIFHSYIFPAILNLYDKGDTTLILEFISIIDILISLEEQFSEVILNSKIKNLNNTKGFNYRKYSEVTEQTSESTEQFAVKTALYHKEQNQLKDDFKKELRNVMEELMSGSQITTSDIDVKQLFLRKFPIMLSLFESKSENNMTLFIINTLNDTQWIILQEFFTNLPQMIGQLEIANRDYIISLFDLAIASNLNELNNYKVLKAFNEIFEGGFVSVGRAIDIFEKALPLIVHPNIWIRKEVMKLYEHIYNKENGYVNKFIALYMPVKDYLNTPTVKLNIDLLNNNCVCCLCRVVYELEVKNYIHNKTLYNDNNNNNNNNSDNKNKNNYNTKAYMKLKTIMNNFRIANYEEDYHFESALVERNKMNNKVSYLSDNIDKEYKVFARMKEGESELTKCSVFFGQIIWYADGLVQYFIPLFKTNNDLNFSVSNELISMERFKLKLILKMLNVSIKLKCINELLDKDKDNDKSNTTHEQQKTINQDPRYYKTSKTFMNWRPEGQLISTLSEHGNQPVERLIQLEDASFYSIDNTGKAVLWKLRDNKDNTHKIQKKWTYKPDINNFEFTYNKAITSLEFTNLVYASKHNLYKLAPEGNSTFSVLASCKEGKDITCVHGVDSKEMRKLFFCSQDGNVNVFDLRTQQIDLSYNIPIQKGILSCICSGFDDNSMFIGTLGGFILHYDLRLNAVTDAFKHQCNTPVIGLDTYMPCRGVMYNLHSYHNDEKNNKYLTVWTGANNHEMGLWNINTTRFDMLFKVNTLYDKETKPLVVEIPCIKKTKRNEHNNYNTPLLRVDQLTTVMSEEKEIALQLTALYNQNYNPKLLSYKQLILSRSNINSDFYINSNKHLNQIQNIYSCTSTVQNAVSPYCDCWENVPYIITVGNDKSIRYWDISEDGVSNCKSFLVNAPCTLSQCVVKKSVFNNCVIVQFNENYDYSEQSVKSDMAGLAEFHNYNGIAYHWFKQNEFVDMKDNENGYLEYCTRIADASHRNVITDLFTVNVNSNKNLMVTCSWDGSVKVWK